MTSIDKCPQKQYRRDGQQGFTLIELMAVVSIVSILAVIALPVYLDYVVRSKVSEAMVFVAEAKTSVSEYYYNNKSIPENNQQGGLPPAAEYDKHQYISRLGISSVNGIPGTITVTIKIPNSKAHNKTLQLIPSTAGAVMSWTCISPIDNGVPTGMAPPSCRG